MDIQWIHFYQKNKAFAITAVMNLSSEKMIPKRLFLQEWKSTMQKPDPSYKYSKKWASW